MFWIRFMWLNIKKASVIGASLYVLKLSNLIYLFNWTSPRMTRHIQRPLKILMPWCLMCVKFAMILYINALLEKQHKHPKPEGVNEKSKFSGRSFFFFSTIRLEIFGAAYPQCFTTCRVLLHWNSLTLIVMLQANRNVLKKYLNGWTWVRLKLVTHGSAPWSVCYSINAEQCCSNSSCWTE